MRLGWRGPSAFGNVGSESGIPEIGRLLIAIETSAVLRGRLSPRALGTVAEWAALHRAELMEDWGLAKAEAQLEPIAPLE